MKNEITNKTISTPIGSDLLHIHGNMSNVPMDFQKDLVFKIAETQNEIQQAQNLIIEPSEQLGFCHSSKSKEIFLKFLLHENTTIVIAKLNDKVIGAISLIRDSSLKLPIDQTFDLSQMREKGKILCEISFLSIEKGFSEYKDIALGLLKFVENFVMLQDEVDICVLTVNPLAKSFYETVCGFRTIQTDLVYHGEDFKNASVVPMYIDARAHNRLWFLKDLHKSSVIQNNYYEFILKRIENFRVPLPKKWNEGPNAERKKSDKKLKDRLLKFKRFFFK